MGHSLPPIFLASPTNAPYTCHSPLGEPTGLSASTLSHFASHFGIPQQQSQPLVTKFFLTYYKVSRNAKNISLECTGTHATIVFLCPCIPTILLSVDSSRERTGKIYSGDIRCGRNDKHKACLSSNGRIKHSLERKTYL
jgi:hypothetical protein